MDNNPCRDCPDRRYCDEECSKYQEYINKEIQRLQEMGILDKVRRAINGL